MKLREISAGKHRNRSRSLSVRKETGMIQNDSDAYISEICLALFFSPLLPEGHHDLCHPVQLGYTLS